MGTKAGLNISSEARGYWLQSPTSYDGNFVLHRQNGQIVAYLG